MSEIVPAHPVPADQAGEQRRWTIEICGACGGVNVCKCSMGGMAIHGKWQRVEVIPASSVADLQAERDSWRRAYKGACQNAEAAERERDELRERIEGVLADLERSVTDLNPDDGGNAPGIILGYRSAAYRLEKALEQAGYLRGEDGQS